jgi:hypothetical protein
MKKIITVLAIVALSTVSAKAIDLSALSLTGGMAANQSVWGATAQQDEYGLNTGVIDATNKQSGAFVEGFSSGFVELGIGQYLALGYELVPGSISTPQNINDGGGNGNGGHGEKTSKVSVDFNDMTTMYAKLNLPFLNGIYLKAGSVSTDLDIKETQLSGNTYKNVSVDGTSFGGGYEAFLGETNFALRLETNYVELDNVTVNNGVGTKTTGGTVANGGFNEVKATNLEGLTGKIALTYTFGRN